MFWLELIGVNAYRSGICHAVAEKVNLMIPGTFDIHTLDSVEEEEEDDELPDYEDQ